MATSKGVSYLVEKGCFAKPAEKKWPETAVAVLLALSGETEAIPASFIARNIKAPLGRVQFLDAMSDPKHYLVRGIFPEEGEPAWQIRRGGTEYLYRNGHI